MVRHANILTLLVTACVVFLWTATTASAAADPNGTWTWSFTTQGGQKIDFSLELKQEGENLIGSLTRLGRDSRDIKDGTFKNDEVSFNMVRERNGEKITTKYRGKVDGDEIKGTGEVELRDRTRSFDWNPTRKNR
jgi:hypothetical protein